MNAVTNAINDIKFVIPPEILQIAFVEYGRYTNNMVTIDEHIMNMVIRPRVLVDANLVGGIQTMVSFNNCEITHLSTREFIVRVPKTLTNNRSIVTALSLVSNVMYNQATSYSDMQAPIDAGINMMNNMGTENIVQTSKLEIIAENTVLVQDPTIHLMNANMRCIVENMDNMENINPRSYHQFSKLCTLAVKAWIYNNTIVKLDKGYIYGGHDLGIIKEIVDNYADAYELYTEHLNLVWAKVAFMSNSDATSRLVVSMIGNTI